MIQVLTDGTSKLHRIRSFQGGESEVYEEECPLAGILNTAYRVRICDTVVKGGAVSRFSVCLWEQKHIFTCT